MIRARCTSTRKGHDTEHAEQESHGRIPEAHQQGHGPLAPYMQYMYMFDNRILFCTLCETAGKRNITPDVIYICRVNMPWNDKVSPVLPVASLAVYASGQAIRHPDIFYFSCVWFIINNNNIVWQPFGWFAFFMLRHASAFCACPNLCASLCLSNLSEKC